MISCTVAIPVFNRNALIDDCLASALAQRCAGLEVLVIDNHSDDGTWERLLRARDPRLRLVRNERNLGLFGNFNRCLDLAQGAYLRLLCSDDRLTAGCLERELAFMEAHPEVALLSTGGQYIDERGMDLGRTGDLLPPGIYPVEGAGGMVLSMILGYGVNPLNYPSGILIRCAALRRSGAFDPSFRVAGDVDLFLRILQHGGLAVSAECGARVMRHAEQVSASETARTRFVLIREFLRLARSNRRHGRPGSSPAWSASSARVSSCLAALSCWLAVACAVQGRFRCAHLHLRFFLRARGPFALRASALCGLVLRRLGHLVATRTHARAAAGGAP
jgi:GT2 family glycosyltransferase